MENHDLQANSKPLHPNTLSWFEFLLNANLLNDHLAKRNADPTATDLIEQFLASSQNREANAMPAIIGGTNNIGDTKDLVLEMKIGSVENKKIKALKLLALKVAAYLNWNLKILEETLPLAVQYVLFCELLKVCLDSERATDVKYHLELEYSALPDQALFSVMIYHCWAIRAVMLRNFPAKPPKTIPVPIPGQQNNSFFPTEHVMKMIHDMCMDSKLILNKIRTLDRDMMVPTINSFDIPTEMKQESDHEWVKGNLITATEVKCQISYDLGCMYFFHEEYSNAGEMFFAVKDFLEALGDNLKFCCIENRRLTGYLKACASILKKKLDNSNSTLEEELQAVISNNYDGLYNLLLLDNEKRELSLTYRQSLENDIFIQMTRNAKLRTLYLEVAICNVVRTVLEGQANVCPFFQTLPNIERYETAIVVKVVKNAFSHANDNQKQYLKEFLCYLCYSGNKHIFSLLFDHDLTKKFTENELESFHPEKQKLTEHKNESVLKRDFKGNTALQVGGLERDLLRSYDPKEIKDVISQLYAIKVRKPLWKINSMWELPSPLNSKIPNILSGCIQDFVYILTAKSRELTKLKNFQQSSELLDVAEFEVGDQSFYLSKLLRWEGLLVDLLQDQTLQSRTEFNNELTKRCKSCIHSLFQDKDIPRAEIIEHCVTYLLTVQQWEYLSTFDYGRGSRFECVHFACVLAKVCVEIRANSGSRKAVKELWELVLPIYSNNNNQQKRSSSGLTNVLQREVPHAIFSKTALTQFIEKIHHVLPISAMISCLAKLHNILKDDSNNNLFLEYSTPWPAVVSNSGAFYIKGVCESLASILNRALQIYPNYPPFLKTMADLNYVLGYHAKCLKYYLEAGVASSDFFHHPVPKNIFDDQVYKRMIRCCSQLTYHTQAAVLCQFLDEVDYLVAFKALQEKNCSDAMDVYYNCFWDVTILEFLVNLHTKRGELDKKQLALRVMGQTELNSSNSDEIKQEAANLRKRQFLRSLTEQCL